MRMTDFLPGLAPTRAKANTRLRVGALVFVALTVGAICIVMLGQLDGLLSRFAEARSDNRTWNITQLEVDLLRLHSAMLHAEVHDFSAPELAEVTRRFDIAYSRVAMIETNPALKGLPLIESQALKALSGPGGFLPEMAGIIDNRPATLAAELERLGHELEADLAPVRASITQTLLATSRESDDSRQELNRSLRFFSFAMVATMGALAVFLATIYLQEQETRRHADRLAEVVQTQGDMIAGSHDAILLVDKDGVIRAANDAGMALMGHGPQVGPPVRLADCLPDHTSACLRAQGQFRRRDGGEVPVEVSIVDALAVGGETYRMAFLRDMSEQLQRERALAAAIRAAQQGEDAKARFLAVMSHEMRTPLNGLLSALELLDGVVGEDPEARWLVDIMRGCGEATLEQINNVLELNHLTEADGKGFPLVDFDLAELMRLQVQRFQGGALLRSNSLVLEADLPAAVLHAPLQLVRRILNNLMSNAIKFTECGEIRLGTSLSPLPGKGRVECRIWVQDSGIGISEADLKRIFHNFETLDNSYSRVQEGSGLGLGIAKLSAEAMGGRIEVESTEGKGSRFTLVFPADWVAVAEAAPAPAPMATTRGPLRILVAEDNRINATLLQRQLERHGHDVTTVHDGAEAIEAVELDKPFDVILMDVSMPRMDGVTATRLLRQAETGAHVPVIALTAQADQRRIAEFRAAGMDEVVTKPVEIGALIALMTEAVARAGSTSRPVPLAPAQPLPTRRPPARLLDVEALAVIGEDMGSDFLADMIARFAAELDALLPELEAALAAGDLDGLAKAAHRSAGSAGVLGFLALGESLRGIEDLALAGGEGLAARLEGLKSLRVASFSDLAQILPQGSA